MPKYKLRLANFDDLNVLSECLFEAFQESPYTDSHTFSHERVVKLATDILMMGPDSGYILLAEDGGRIVGIFSGLKSYTTMGLEETAMELIWWVHPDFRKTRLAIELVLAFEYWAKQVGVSRLVLGNMNNSHSEATEKFYFKNGYKLTEKTYIKRVTN